MVKILDIILKQFQENSSEFLRRVEERQAEMAEEAMDAEAEKQKVIDANRPMMK